VLKLPIDVGIDTLIDPDHTNRPNGYLENLAVVLVQSLCGSGIINRGVLSLPVDANTGRLAVPDPANPVVGIINGQFFVLGNDREASGTVASGDMGQLVDGGRAEAPGFWQDAWVVFTSGANAGQTRKVTSSDPQSHILTWGTPLAAPVQAGDGYVVSFFYIQGLTAGALNYVYGRASDSTAPLGVVQWVANTTGTKAAGDILVATVTLDANGAVVDQDESPDGVDRWFYPGAGQVHEIDLAGTLENLAPAASVTIERTHDELILLGPISAQVDNPKCSLVIVDGWQPDRVVFCVTNNDSYPVSSVSYAVTRKGRKLMVL
jgi:hypothetical protein